MRFSWGAIMLFAIFILLVNSSPLKKLKIAHYFVIFIAADLADVISTFNAVHGYGVSWAFETNQFIQFLGKRIGFDAAVIISFAMSLGIVGLFLVGVWQVRPLLAVMAKATLLVAVVDSFLAAAHNLLLPFGNLPLL